MLLLNHLAIEQPPLYICQIPQKWLKIKKSDFLWVFQHWCDFCQVFIFTYKCACTGQRKLDDCMALVTTGARRWTHACKSPNSQFNFHSWTLQVRTFKIHKIFYYFFSIYYHYHKIQLVETLHPSVHPVFPPETVLVDKLNQPICLLMIWGSSTSHEQYTQPLSNWTVNKEGDQNMFSIL